MNDVKMRFFEDIEKIRGFACILVLMQHILHQCPIVLMHLMLPDFCKIGSGAVNIFFAISGFLITLSLMDKIESLRGDTFLSRLINAKPMLVSFYKRRFFRIVPVLLTVIILIGFFLLLTEDDLSWLPALLRTPFEVLCGVYNNAVELFVKNEKIHSFGMGPMWTLAVESQFYLFWPLVLIFCKNNNSRAVVSLVLGILFMIVVRPVCTGIFGFKYYMTHYNVSELFFGSFFAFLYDGKVENNINKKTFNLLAIILMLVIWWYPGAINDQIFYSNIVVTFASVLLVMMVIFCDGNLRLPILDSILRYLGKISYSFYVVQLFLAQVVIYFTNSIYFPKESFSTYEFICYQFIIYVMVLMIGSWLLYTFVEKPARSLGDSRK